MAVDPAGDSAAQVLGAAAGEPPWREHADGEPLDAAGPGVEVEGGAVVPLHVVERVGRQLVAHQVQVPPPRPVVVEVRDAQRRARRRVRVVGQVREQHRVETLRPRRRRRRRGRVGAGRMLCRRVRRRRRRGGRREQEEEEQRGPSGGGRHVARAGGRLRAEGGGLSLLCPRVGCWWSVPRGHRELNFLSISLFF